MLKIVSKNFIYALLLFLGLFLKIFRWVPLHINTLIRSYKIGVLRVSRLSSWLRSRDSSCWQECSSTNINYSILSQNKTYLHSPSRRLVEHRGRKRTQCWSSTWFSSPWSPSKRPSNKLCSTFKINFISNVVWATQLRWIAPSVSGH